MNKALVKIAESLAFAEDRDDYLLQPAALRILDRDGIEHLPVLDLAEAFESHIQLRYGGKSEVKVYRGGRLEDALRTDADRLRDLLLEELALAAKHGTSALALPASFPDWDSNELFTTGDLVSSLALHLADVLTERAEALRGGGQPTLADWSRSSAEALGLVAALQELLDPAFLEKSRYLVIFLEAFNGFQVPSRAEGI